jgi:uncharacterized protein (TIGR03032 family)
MQSTHPLGNVSPFQCSYSPQIPELLLKLQCSLAISTYQAGKIVFLSPKDENFLIQLPRTFDKPMGFSFDENNEKMVLACRDEVILFKNVPDLAAHYPKSPGTYDAMFLPRVTYHSGALDIHDLHFGKDNVLYGINTLFSCIVTFDESYNFTPYWTPPFISELASEDRCHLNGMAMHEGKPLYASAFNTGDTPRSWRDNITNTGVIFNVETNNQIAEGLAMPHSPKIYNDKLYVLLSATGQLVEVDINSGKTNEVYRFDAFLRGMTLVGDYLFISHSKLRKNSSTFSKLPFAEKADKCGIYALHLPSGSLAGHIEYKTSVDEIYDLHALKGILRPNILNTKTEDHKMALHTPESNYWARNINQNQ